MASVSSLDQDMRKLRMERYTPQAAQETKSWIEETLGERLAAGDLIDALKDGVALCKLANLLLPAPGIRYKASSMPFTQRENISHFLQACERPPLNLPAHDRFLTVDLYDNKDPAQVVQCIQAFSRAANALNSAKFKRAIGPRKGATSPTRRVPLYETNTSPRPGGLASPSSTLDNSNARAVSPSLTGGSNSSRSPEANGGSLRSAAGTVSSWRTKDEESKTAPAWNIHQYGYMGGASQGNQGISFGARRQITAPSPKVPSVVEKERRLKEQEAEIERKRAETEEAERARRRQMDLEEQRSKEQEQLQWEEETKKARERERQQVEEEKRRWQEQERKWKEEEERRQREEAEATSSTRAVSNPSVLRGQTLSQYQSEQKQSESERIRELERQLEEAKERERQYQLEREQQTRSVSRTPEPEATKEFNRRPPSFSPDQSKSSWADKERERVQLRREWNRHQNEEQTQQDHSFEDEQPPSLPARSAAVEEEEEPPALPSRNRVDAEQEENAPSLPSRPLPVPTHASESQAPTTSKLGGPLSAPQAQPQPAVPASASAEPPRPLPRPANFARNSGTTAPQVAVSENRTERFLSSNPAPVQSKPRTFMPAEMGMSSASERAAEDARRNASQAKTKAGGWASKSLLEREMEMERERQREWEEQQMAQGKNLGAPGRPMGPRQLKK